MAKNKNKENTIEQGRESITYYDSKNTSSSISSVVKTEIYPQKREKKVDIKPPHLPYSAERVEQHPIQTDPYGSYTGVPAIPLEAPVQDVDDL